MNFMWYHLEPIRFLFFYQIFTNSDRIHARKALQRLGLEDCFDDIICFETLNPNLFQSHQPDEFPVLLKPSMDAMKIALDVAGSDPTRTVGLINKETHMFFHDLGRHLSVWIGFVFSVLQLFLDDNDRNISAGKALGLRTALVSFVSTRLCFPKFIQKIECITTVTDGKSPAKIWFLVILYLRNIILLW